MNTYERNYAGQFIKAWRQYHKDHSHVMQIEARANGASYAWSASNDNQRFILMRKTGEGFYCPVSLKEKRTLAELIALKSLEIIGFDHDLKLFLNVSRHLDAKLSALEHGKNNSLSR